MQVFADPKRLVSVLISGVAAIATLRLRPTGWQRVVWTVASVAFLLVTSVLFGWSLNAIVPIYDGRRP